METYRHKTLPERTLGGYSVLLLRWRNGILNYRVIMEKNILRVLLVDDDVDYVEVVRHYLHPFQNNEFEVLAANNQEQALATLSGSARLM